MRKRRRRGWSGPGRPARPARKANAKAAIVLGPARRQPAGAAPPTCEMLSMVARSPACRVPGRALCCGGMRGPAVPSLLAQGPGGCGRSPWSFLWERSSTRRRRRCPKRNAAGQEPLPLRRRARSGPGCREGREGGGGAERVVAGGGLGRLRDACVLGQGRMRPGARRARRGEQCLSGRLVCWFVSAPSLAAAGYARQMRLRPFRGPKARGLPWRCLAREHMQPGHEGAGDGQGPAAVHAKACVLTH
jgi:hypothetical protein